MPALRDHNTTPRRREMGGSTPALRDETAPAIPDPAELQDRPLLELAQEIHHHAGAAESAARAAVLHAARAGACLLAAKAKLGHGEFGVWVDEHCEFSYRTARDYMKVARAALAKRQHAAILDATSIRSALAAISEASPRRDSKPEKPPAPPEDEPIDAEFEVTPPAPPAAPPAPPSPPADEPVDWSDYTSGDDAEAAPGVETVCPPAYAPDEDDGEEDEEVDESLAELERDPKACRSCGAPNRIHRVCHNCLAVHPIPEGLEGGDPESLSILRREDATILEWVRARIGNALVEARFQAGRQDIPNRMACREQIQDDPAVARGLERVAREGLEEIGRYLERALEVAHELVRVDREGA